VKPGFINFVFTFILFSMMTACASHPPEPVPLDQKLGQLGYTLGQPVKRVINFQLNGWNYVDHKHVIMNFGASRYYLLTLRTSCDGLRSATVITFSTTIGNLTENDKVLVRNAGRHLSHCYIETINELEKIKSTDKEK